jgi:hypothetical protein
MISHKNKIKIMLPKVFDNSIFKKILFSKGILYGIYSGWHRGLITLDVSVLYINIPGEILELCILITSYRYWPSLRSF